MSLRILLGGVAMAALTACSGSDGITLGGGTGGVGTGTTTLTCSSGLAANSAGTACTILGGQLTGTTLLTAADSPYTLNGRLDVGVDNVTAGTLTIEPGVTIIADDGSDFVVVNRGSTINAIGSPSAPIVFTSAADFNGTQTDPANAIGEWGGMVILGNAPINNCAGAVSSSLTPGDAGCQNVIEGVPAPNAIYGGGDSTDSSGTLRYVQVKHAGFAIEQGNELNGISFGGVGTGTTVEFVQVHNNSDDGIEMFGGTVDLSNIVLTGIDDDSLDTDNGWTGTASFVLAIQADGRGDNLMEMSSAGSGNDITALPTDPIITNFTLIGSTGADYLFDMNSGHQGSFYNGVGVNTSEECFRLGEVVENEDTMGNTVSFTLGKTLPGDANGAYSTANDPFFASVRLECEGGGGADTLVQADGVVTPDATGSRGSAPGAETLADQMIAGGTDFVVDGESGGLYDNTLVAPTGGTIAFLNDTAEDAVTPTAVPGFGTPSGIGADPDGTEWWTFACGLVSSNPC